MRMFFKWHLLFAAAFSRSTEMLWSTDSMLHTVLGWGVRQFSQENKRHRENLNLCKGYSANLWQAQKAFETASLKAI